MCTLGDDVPALAVLDTVTQYTQLAATVVRDPDAPGVAEALAALVRQRSSDSALQTVSGTDWRVTGEIDRARQALTSDARAAVLLPEQTDPVVLDRDHSTDVDLPRPGPRAGGPRHGRVQGSAQLGAAPTPPAGWESGAG